MTKKDKKTAKKKCSNYDRGFTLVEAMFAVFILTFVIVSLMSVVSSSLYSARYAKQEIIMNFLIQEALDGIRNDRDSGVFLGDEEWEDFVNRYTNNCEESKGCQIEIGIGEDPTIKSCPNSNSCGKIYLNEEADVPYNHASEGENTYMRRYIIAEEIPMPLDPYVVETEGEPIPGKSTYGLKIKVVVIWDPPTSLFKERSVEMTLLDWR